MNRKVLPNQLDEADLVRMSRIFVAIATSSLTNHEDVSIQQYRALALLASKEGQRPVDLARSLGVTPSTTTTLCNRLVQKRLISRRRGGADRRSLTLFVTTLGHERLEKIAARRGALLREIFVRLPSEVQAPFAATLLAFIEVASEVDVNEWSIKGLVAGRASVNDEMR